jgi:putative ABC transport system permease protein
VLGFTLGVSLLTSLLFGLVPALQASKVNLNETLKEGARTGMVGAARNRLRGALVVSEVCLAMVLLVGAGLMIKSLWQLSKVNPGYDPSNVLTLSVDLPGGRYKEKQQIAEFYRQAIERISALPGVADIGAVNSLGVSVGFGIDEHPQVDVQRRPQAWTRFVSPRYFDALRIPLMRGRVFTGQDGSDTAPVVVIDETLARRHFPGEDPVGKHLNVWGSSREIVGVVGEAKYGSPSDKPTPVAYLPYTQMTWSGMTLFVRSSLAPEELTPSIRNEIQAIDKDQPVYDVKLLEQSLSESTAPRRYTSLLLAAFAALALTLAAVGLYGVMAYTVAQRTHEIGVRVALGAQRADVLKLVLRQGMTLVLIGTAVGLVAAVSLTRLMENLLYGVSATDPATFVAIVLLLTGVSLLACYIPARRATKVDPMIALRYE